MIKKMSKAAIRNGVVYAKIKFGYLCRGTAVFCVLLFGVFLSACTKFEYHETVQVPINTMSEEQENKMDESLFLDVGVVLFDHGIDEFDDEVEGNINLRKSESVWFTSQLKNTLEKSNAWGLIRALPKNAPGMDVLITGRIIESNGERVALQIAVYDASGQVWFDKAYEQVVSQYAYNPEVNFPGDPFQGLFNRISNDIFNYRNDLSESRLREIRKISNIVFAREFVPAAFSPYLQKNEDGVNRLVRIPSGDDPLLQNINRIRSRNDLFLDVIQDYYRGFNQRMSVSYQELRKVSYKEVQRERQLREQGRKEKIAGVVAIVAGVAVSTSSRSNSTQIGGFLGSVYGAQLFARSFLKTDQALAHSERLRELGRSLELELEPSVIDLQDQSVTLTGTVADQFAEWQRILSRMFELETGAVNDSLKRSVTTEKTNVQE